MNEVLEEFLGILAKYLKGYGLLVKIKSTFRDMAIQRLKHSEVG